MYLLFQCPKSQTNIFTYNKESFFCINPPSLPINDKWVIFIQFMGHKISYWCPQIVGIPGHKCRSTLTITLRVTEPVLLLLPPLHTHWQYINSELVPNARVSLDLSLRLQPSVTDSQTVNKLCNTHQHNYISETPSKFHGNLILHLFVIHLI